MEKVFTIYKISSMYQNDKRKKQREDYDKEKGREGKKKKNGRVGKSRGQENAMGKKEEQQQKKERDTKGTNREGKGEGGRERRGTLDGLFTKQLVLIELCNLAMMDHSIGEQSPFQLFGDLVEGEESLRLLGEEGLHDEAREGPLSFVGLLGKTEEQWWKDQSETWFVLQNREQ